MKIFITGGSGQVGRQLKRALAPLGGLIAPSRSELDLSDVAKVEQFLAEQQPDLIVNAAAFTAVDQAESSPELANQLNAAVPRLLAQYASASDKWIIHYSSDYVYDGEGDHYRLEDQGLGPLSVYGHSKFRGDQAVQSSGAKHLIFRTSWVYGLTGKNFMRTMLALASTQDSLRIIDDQYGAPTSAALIAQVTGYALYRIQIMPDDPGLPIGVYHLAPRGATSWHGFAMEIFNHARALNVPLRVEPHNVCAIATKDYPAPATRPKNSRLSVSKLEETFGLALPDWREQVSQIVAEYFQNK